MSWCIVYYFMWQHSNECWFTSELRIPSVECRESIESNWNSVAHRLQLISSGEKYVNFDKHKYQSVVKVYIELYTSIEWSFNMRIILVLRKNQRIFISNNWIGQGPLNIFVTIKKRQSVDRSHFKRKIVS